MGSLWLPLRSNSEERLTELDAGHILPAGSPGRGAAAGSQLRRRRQGLRHPQRRVSRGQWAAAVRCRTSRYHSHLNTARRREFTVLTQKPSIYSTVFSETVRHLCPESTEKDRTGVGRARAE